MIIDRHWVVQGHRAQNGGVVIDIVLRRGTSSPNDDGSGVWISGSHSMCEVQGRRVDGGRASISFVHLVNRDTEARMVVRRASIIDVGGIACQSSTCEQNGN